MVREEKLGFKETFWILVFILCTVSIQFPSVVPSYHHGNQLQASEVSPGASYQYSTGKTWTELRMKAPEEAMDLMEVYTMSGGRRMCVYLLHAAFIGHDQYTAITLHSSCHGESSTCAERKETRNTFTVALLYTTTPSTLPILPPSPSHRHT